MNFQIRITLIILLTISFKFVFPQGSKTEKNHTLNNIINVEKAKNHKFFGRYNIGVMYSYQHSNFYAAKFNENLENGLIEHGYGDSYSIRQSLYPIIIDISGFISRYNSPVSKTKIKFRGFEIDGAIRIPYLPIYLLRPYIGVGYQYSQVDNDDSYINTSQTIWKVGITTPMIAISWITAIYINAEYKQSLDLSSPYSFNQLSIGLGFQF